MNLKEFYDYKNKFMEDILTDTTITSLVDPESVYETPTGLAYTQIFPYEYLPDTADKGKTFICFDVDVSGSYDRTFYIPNLYVWVFTHRSLMRIPEGGVLVDELCARICERVNGSRFYGLGSLDFVSSKRFAPISDYQGKVLTFETSDFNRKNDPGRELPTKRKSY